jgi:hypothetical protein
MKLEEKGGLNSYGVMFIQSLMNIRQLLEKLSGREEQADTKSLSFPYNISTVGQ